MRNRKFKRESYKKRFFRPNNRLLRVASSIINNLEGATNEEKLGQFEMVVHTEEFHKRYPGFIGEDVATIIRSELIDY
jgi:hypothetical protein